MVYRMSDNLSVITATAAAWIGVIVYFVSYLPFSFFGSERQYAEVTANAKFGMSLVPNLAMAIGCKILAQYESTGVLNSSVLFALHAHKQIYTFLGSFQSKF